MVLLLLLLLGVPPGEPQKERAIVMPVDVAAEVASVVTKDERVRLEEEVGRVLSRYRRLDASTWRDVQKLADLEAERQVTGCDNASCASEIASAVGARFVVVSRVERRDQLLQLTVTLLDGNEARLVARGTARAQRAPDLRAQVAFAVDDAIVSLRSPGDPTPAEIFDEGRAKLAVLPVRGLSPVPPGVRAAVDEAAAAAARQLGLALLSASAYAELIKARGCAADDHTCGLAAVAARGVVLGLGVSIKKEEPRTTARASLLLPDGATAQRAEELVVDEQIGRAVTLAVEAVVQARLDGKSAPPLRVAAAQTATPTTSAERTDDDDEKLHFKCGAYRGGMFPTWGECVATRTTLSFSEKPNRVDETFALADIDAVEAFSVGGLYPNGMRLRMKNGEFRDFGVQGFGAERDRVVPLLRDLVDDAAPVP